ncbi:MAG: lysylphosphatidylglycerol synthase transmembrane domain-containing protein [Candidatus Aenigmatarchaeota archaeon]
MNGFRFLPLVGIAIFLLLLARLDVSTMASILLYSNPVFLALSIMATLSLAALKAFRWKVLIRPFGYDCPFPKAMTSWLSGFFIGIITPGRIGDLSRALYLKKELGLGKSLNTVVVDRIIDIVSLLLFAISGAFILTAVYSQSQMMVTAMALMAVFSCALLVVARKSSMKLIARPIFNRLVPDEHKSGVRITFHEFYEGLGLIVQKKRSLMMAFTLSAISIFLLSLQYYFITMALGLSVSYEFPSSWCPSFPSSTPFLYRSPGWAQGTWVSYSSSRS